MVQIGSAAAQWPKMAPLIAGAVKTPPRELGCQRKLKLGKPEAFDGIRTRGLQATALRRCSEYKASIYWLQGATGCAGQLAQCGFSSAAQSELARELRRNKAKANAVLR
jgi:hypothetical protein